MAKILLVEDQAFIANVYALLLRSGGYDVTVVHDRILALDAIRTEPFDLVITDMVLADVSGLDLVRAVRERGQAIAIVLTAGSPLGHDADVMAARDVGAFETLFKPVTRDQLIGSVARALNTKNIAKSPHISSVKRNAVNQ